MLQKTFFVNAVTEVGEEDLYVNINLEKTSEALNAKIEEIAQEGYIIESITPINVGVGQYECKPIFVKGSGLQRWFKQLSGGVGYGFGYSYTNGFIILANQANESSGYQTS
jgi:hypothetical protein